LRRALLSHRGQRSIGIGVGPRRIRREARGGRIRDDHVG
jgi:hypothetical protein